MESLEGDSEIKSQSETNNKVKKIIKRTVSMYYENKKFSLKIYFFKFHIIFIYLFQ